MKKTMVALLLAGMVLLCCSCGDIYRMALAAREQPWAEATAAPFDLPGLPPGDEMPEATDTDEATAADSEFDELIDTEGLAGGRSISIEEAQGMGYAQGEDGYYAKDATFMGRQGVVRLGFNIGGKSNYVDYSYSASADAVTPQMVLREFTRLYDAVKAKYGKATVHTWALSKTRAQSDLYEVGEFDDEEVLAAIRGNQTAVFQYAWRRVGDSAAYVYLSLLSDGTYTLGFLYDSSNPVPRQTAGI